MSDNDVAGVFEVIDTEIQAHDPVEQETVAEPKGEGAEAEDQGGSEQKQTSEESKQTETGQTDEGQTQQTESEEESNSSQEQETKTETSEESKDSKDETSKTETKSAEDFSNWHEGLPPPPPDYNGPKPEYNEQGQIVNMTPEEYNDYITANAAIAYKKEAHNNVVEARAFQVAEEIIPELRTNQAIRMLVQNARTASILSGQPIDTVQAALQVRDALGLSPEKIQAAKTEGAQNAKASITVQKNAALETSSTQTKDSESVKITELQKRISRGDDNAFVDLLGIWEKNGII